MTYLLLLFTAVGLSFFIVNTPIKKIESNILSNKLETLCQKSSLIDEKLNNLEKVAYQICNDPLINEIVPADSGGSFYMDLNTSKEQLFNYRFKLDDDFVYDYFVYYANRNYVVTPDTCYSSDFFCSYIIQPLNDTSQLNSFLHLIGSKQTKIMSKSTSFSYMQKNFKGISYIMPIPLLGKPDEIENLCTLIPSSYFDQIFPKKDFSNSGYLQIFNDSGEALLSLDYGGYKEPFTGVDVSSISRNSAFNKKINGKKLTVVCTISKQSNWKYLWVQPQAVAMNDLFSMRYNIILLFIATLVIGIAIAVALAYYNSRPILHIAESLGKTNSGMHRSCDTFKGYLRIS